MSADRLGFFPMPLGTVIAFAGSPDAAAQAELMAAGWLLCDGRAVNRTTHQQLYAAIGNVHGSGDGTSTFNLPDYRGRFLRGTDGGSGRDPDAAARSAPAAGGQAGAGVGSVQADDFRAHQHPLTEWIFNNNVDGLDSTGVHSWEHHPEARATSPTGGSETRPVNAAVQWLILAGTPINPAPAPTP